MLLLLINENAEALDRALDTLATGLAFERSIDVVFLYYPKKKSQIQHSKLAVLKELGLQRFFVFATAEHTPTFDKTLPSMQKIKPSEFRALCQKHRAIVSF